VQFYKKASASRPPDPLLELRPWTPLQDFRPPVFFYDPPIICEIDALAANTNYGYCWTGTDLLNRLSPSRPTVDRTISSKICSNIHSRFTALCPGPSEWAGTRRDIHPLTPVTCGNLSSLWLFGAWGSNRGKICSNSTKMFKFAVLTQYTVKMHKLSVLYTS